MRNCIRAAIETGNITLLFSFMMRIFVYLRFLEVYLINILFNYDFLFTIRKSCTVGAVLCLIGFLQKIEY